MTRCHDQDKKHLTGWLTAQWFTPLFQEVWWHVGGQSAGQVAENSNRDQQAGGKQ